MNAIAVLALSVEGIEVFVEGFDFSDEFGEIFYGGKVLLDGSQGCAGGSHKTALGEECQRVDGLARRAIVTVEGCEFVTCLDHVIIGNDDSVMQFVVDGGVGVKSYHFHLNRVRAIDALSDYLEPVGDVAKIEG